MTNTAGKWFQRTHAAGQVELRMFCFPYAGGTAAVYRTWADCLPRTVQVIPVELPGRGHRLKEAPFLSVPPLIDVLAEAIQPLIDTPFVFFGHSMGAVIAFELARRLSHDREIEPQALFVSGRQGPPVPDTEPPTYLLPRDQFIEELGRLEGTPKEVLEHAELMELMIPLLRADFQLIQTYEYVSGIPLRCPIIAYGGLEDRDVSREDLLPWKEMTSSTFALHMLPGDHFFLRSSQTLLLRLLAQGLREVIARLSCSAPADRKAGHGVIMRE